MEDVLKSGSSFVIMRLIQLARQADKNAYNKLYALIDVKYKGDSLYFEPDYIKEEKAKLKADEETKRTAIEDAKKAEMLRRTEVVQKKREEDKQKREAKRLAKIEAEEKERKLLEQKEFELVEHLKATATSTLRKIVNDMVFIEGASSVLGNVNNNSNPPHMETVESFWIKKHPITKGEMEDLLVDYSISTSNISKFVQRLSKVLGTDFDIPTPVQLEFAMRAKDKNYVPSNSLIREIGDDRMIDYRKSTEIVKGDKVLMVNSYFEPIISFEDAMSAEKFRIVCSDTKFRSIIEEFDRTEDSLIISKV